MVSSEAAVLAVLDRRLQATAERREVAELPLRARHGLVHALRHHGLEEEGAVVDVRRRLHEQHPARRLRELRLQQGPQHRDVPERSASTRARPRARAVTTRGGSPACRRRAAGGPATRSRSR